MCFYNILMQVLLLVFQFFQYDSGLCSDVTFRLYDCSIFQAGKGGDLTHDETTIITGALELTEKTAKDAMTPISKAFSLDLDATLNLWVCELFIVLSTILMPSFVLTVSSVSALKGDTEFNNDNWSQQSSGLCRRKNQYYWTCSGNLSSVSDFVNRCTGLQIAYLYDNVHY